MESPEGKWIARVQAGVLIVNQIESAFFQETGLRFQFSKYKSRDRATIFGLDLDDCPVLLALFSNGCDLCWQWSHGARVQACSHPTVDWWRTKTDVSVQAFQLNKGCPFTLGGSSSVSFMIVIFIWPIAR